MPAGFAWAAGLLLPVLFWICRWQDWSFWWCGLALLPLAILAIPRQTRENRQPSLAAVLPGFARWLPGIIAATLGLSALAFRDSLPLQYYPVLCNLFFFLVFAASLTQEQSLIERLARRMEPDFPPAAARYTRKVTQAWCLFFLGNGAIAFWSIGAGETVWALYNGGIAYILMACMFAGEWLIRRRVKRRLHASANNLRETRHV